MSTNPPAKTGQSDASLAPSAAGEETSSAERHIMQVRGHNGTVTLDEDFITISRKGFLARASVGKGEKRIPISQISAVQFKPAGTVMNGFIQFTVGGGVEVRSRFGSQTRSAVQDENSVIFHWAQREAFQALREAVEQKIAERHRPHHGAAQVSTPSIPEQISQLAALRDAGILTEEEFNAKKAELLSRL